MKKRSPIRILVNTTGSAETAAAASQILLVNLCAGSKQKFVRAVLNELKKNHDS